MSGLFSRTLALAFAAIVLESGSTAGRQTGASAYPITAVPFSAVRLTDAFWAPRVETNRAVTHPVRVRKSEEEGPHPELRAAAARHEGAYEGKMPFDDTDVYKLIEGAVLLPPEPP